jgi:hypothetical protein
VSGTFTAAIETSLDGVTYTSNPGTSAKTSFRFVRPVITTPLGTDTLLVSAPPKISLSILSRSESGLVTTSASVATLVQLTGHYSSAQNVQVTPANTTASRTAVFDRLLVHPESGLMLQYDFNGSGDNTEIRTISTAARTIASGDNLEYDVYIASTSPVTTTFANGGILIGFTDATTSAAATAVDGFLLHAPGTPFDALARGVWVSRKASLTAFIGKISNAFGLSNAGDAASGTATILYRNIRITDGAGTTRLTLWSAGEPTANVDSSTALVTNVRCGPSNSFNVYAFTTSTGAQVASDVRWDFSGF